MIDTPIAVLRFALYADLALVFGVPMFVLYALQGAERGGLTAALWPWLAGTALLGAVLGAAGIVMLASSMAGVPLREVDRASIEVILLQTSIGTAAIARVSVLILAGLLAPLVCRSPVRALSGIAFCGAIALGSLAWTGHAAMNDGMVGWVHLIADIGHLLAGGAWIGAILGLALLLFSASARCDDRRLRLSHRALAGFATTGSILVSVIVVTGVVNSWILIGPERISALPRSLYGQLLTAKLVVFALMLALAAANRYLLTPKLAGSAGRARAEALLRKSLLLEVTCGLTILGLVAWLGMLEPPTPSAL